MHRLFNRLRRLNLAKIHARLVPGWRHLHLSRIRRCLCCERVSLVEVRDPRGERQRCLLCGANLRYEMLAVAVRRLGDLHSKTVLELDYRSPLQGLLSQAGIHHRSYFDPADKPGQMREDGARCEDITALTFPDAAIDLLVSSEVLEHVPDFDAAAREITRVLKPGGLHLFTVPTAETHDTVQRAKLEGGQVVHLMTPEYHGDSTTGGGILAFWSFGLDLAGRMDRYGLKTSVLLEKRNDQGELLRIVWGSIKPSDPRRP